MSRDFIPGAEPLFLEGSEIGCLLLHGAGGATTWDLKEFANTLHSKTGMTIWLPALSGYGTKPEDLIPVTFGNLLSDAHAGVDKLLNTCQRIFVLGHSMGGVLSLVLASKTREVSGVVTWATPRAVNTRLLSILPILSKIPLLRRTIPETHSAPVPQWLKDQGWIGYEWLPTTVGLIMVDGFKRLKKALANIICPVLIIQGTKDRMITSDSAKRLYESVSSERKEIHMIEGAHHPLMNEEKYKDQLFDITIEFLESL